MVPWYYSTIYVSYFFPLYFNHNSTSKWATKPPKLLPKQSTRLYNFILNYQLNRILRKHHWGHQQRIRMTPYYQPKGKPDTRRDKWSHWSQRSLNWNFLSWQKLPLDLRQHIKPFSPGPMSHWALCWIVH